MKKPSLGRGLSALLHNPETDITTRKRGADAPVVGSINNLKIEDIVPNPFQPRNNFEETTLKELSQSIIQYGVIQPVTVRKVGYDRYQLISGERRFRASKLAGLSEIPAYIRIADDEKMLEMALVENIQREELDAIEIAISYERLISECNITQEGLAEKVSRQRSTVTNYLRLLKLPDIIQKGIRDKQIQMGHARSLLSVEDKDLQLAIFGKIIEEELSVRDVERMARGEKLKRKISVVKRTIHSVEDKKLIERVKKIMGAKVLLKRKKNGTGQLTLPFRNTDQLQRIIDKLEV